MKKKQLNPIKICLVTLYYLFIAAIFGTVFWMAFQIYETYRVSNGG